MEHGCFDPNTYVYLDIYKHPCKELFPKNNNLTSAFETGLTDRKLFSEDDRLFVGN